MKPFLISLFAAVRSSLGLFAIVASMFAAVRSSLGLFAIVAALALVFQALTDSAFAQTDITATVSSLSSLWTTIETLAIGIILFVLGRKLLRKV